MRAKAEWFAGRLRELREGAGLTQKGLAGKAGLGLRAVTYLESGERKPTWETVLVLCEALGAAPADFLREPAPRPPAAPGRPSAPPRCPRGRRKRQGRPTLRVRAGRSRASRAGARRRAGELTPAAQPAGWGGPGRRSGTRAAAREAETA
jgi:transcriptional regulator with XRE-family HTH domain